MRASDIIRRKRDGAALADADIRRFIDGYTRGEIPDYQAAALLMAVFLRGLDGAELRAWTEAMLHSGEIVDLADVPGRKVDKHSTGGVGDKVSLCLAPIVAEAGVAVPMVSGRGLGHTGGTLDKLEAIPGFQVTLPTDRFRELVGRHGFALIGQTETIAPADRKLYALRDVTATVESIPLIASSILSKKLAEGIDALVLDVKVGRGAFMKRVDDARRLAEVMIDLGERMGTRIVALLTAMDQPLGRAVGNALELTEAVAVLEGRGPDDLSDLTESLAVEMLLLGGAAEDAEAARERVRTAVASGAALERLRRLVSDQGGDAEALTDSGRLPVAPLVRPLAARASGWIEAMDAEGVGRAAMALGAGRETKEATIDPAVGVVLRRKVGDRVEAGEPMMDIHARDAASAEAVEAALDAAVSISDDAVVAGPLIHERLP